MIAAVLVPLLVLVAAVLLERYESRVAPRETLRTRTDGAPTATAPVRHLHVVRDAGGPGDDTAHAAVPALSQAS